ncbi:hypothetical protein G6F59_014738 [Rhizopus arrhizus]|nr:hypothetical protein G6F59_014738 [Rhizopus arrhizus]
MRRCGKSKRAQSSAARTRSRDSRTLVSARPTIWVAGRPPERCTSTRTSGASTPARARLWTSARLICGILRRGRSMVRQALRRPLSGNAGEAARRIPAARLREWPLAIRFLHRFIKASVILSDQDLPDAMEGGSWRSRAISRCLVCPSMTKQTSQEMHMYVPKTLVALIAAAALAPVDSASAQALVKGGGASMPASLYKGATDNILPAEFSYVVLGSGNGKRAQ